MSFLKHYKEWSKIYEYFWHKSSYEAGCFKAELKKLLPEKEFNELTQKVYREAKEMYKDCKPNMPKEIDE